MLRIDKSNIDNHGVFANIDLSANTLLHYFKGIEMNYKEFNELYDDTKYCYSMRRINKIIVGKDEPYKSQNLSSYMNESNDPNIIFKKRAVYTLRDIKKDEECLLKYPLNYKRDYFLDFSKKN